MFDSQSDLAALVYDEHQNPDDVLGAFAAMLRSTGYRVAGLVQGLGQCSDGLLAVTLIHTGETVPLLGDRGPGAKGCKLDVGQLLRAGAEVASALDQGADILIINRFGKQEQEGKGLLYLIDRAVSANIPVLIAVRNDTFLQWIKFTEGMSVKLSCNLAALNDWWNTVSGPGHAHPHHHHDFCQIAK